MSHRTRAWLRTFLDLGARAAHENISRSAIEHQEDTVLRALDMLDTRPGIVLADEVGMGKTYEALGVAAATRHARKQSRIVVITPGPDLNTKWHNEFSRFRDMYPFGDDIVPVRRLSEFVTKLRSRAIVVAPVTMFQSGRGTGAQSYLLSLYFHWKPLHGRTANAIMARFQDAACERVDVERARFLGHFELARVQPHLKQAFCRGRSGGAAGLDDLYEEGGLQAFENSKQVRSALYRARFVLTGQLMPTIDLLIVDEAHKLKNAGSLRTRGIRQVFKRRFRKALFLTATPFQLDVDELRQVFTLFAGAKGAPKDLLEQADGLLGSVRDYQERYNEFQRAWSTLDPAVAARFRAFYDNDKNDENNDDDSAISDDPSLLMIARQIDGLRQLKEQAIEPGFRRWMIRSLRPEKRVYRRHLHEKLRAEGAAALPFLIYERFIAELFRQGQRTHKAAVEINMVSSYAAASSGQILSSDHATPAQARAYGDLLRQILGEFGEFGEVGDAAPSAHRHPKFDHVVGDALDAAERGDKTLIFCTRVATLKQLRRELEAAWLTRMLERWQRVYPGATDADVFDHEDADDKRRRGRHSLLRDRLHRTQDALYLALREPYLRTLVPIADWALTRVPEIVIQANRLLQTVRVGKTAAERRDYQIAKRCVEQAAVELWCASRLSSRARADNKTRKTRETGQTINEHALANLREPDFLRLGLDLHADEYENDSLGDERPRWTISEPMARRVMGSYGGLWHAHLDGLALDIRVRVVEQLARYLTHRDVPFLADLSFEAHAAGLSLESMKSAPVLAFMPRFWRTDSGRRWSELLNSFLGYFTRRDPAQRRVILDGAIKTGTFARDTSDGESRERLREAFNTPLYPMVLIANEVMQEGLDLHKSCRRVVHHDLAWNPAQLEQRVGRVDRLGSLTSRLRENNTDITLDVVYPVIRDTIDERLYHKVKDREKWLEFLLGAAPDFSEYNAADTEPPRLPERLGAELAVDLRPKR